MCNQNNLLCSIEMSQPEPLFRHLLYRSSLRRECDCILAMVVSWDCDDELALQGRLAFQQGDGDGSPSSTETQAITKYPAAPGAAAAAHNPSASKACK